MAPTCGAVKRSHNGRSMPTVCVQCIRRNARAESHTYVAYNGVGGRRPFAFVHLEQLFPFGFPLKERAMPLAHRPVLLLVNGVIHTMDEQTPRVSALAI